MNLDVLATHDPGSIGEYSRHISLRHLPPRQFHIGGQSAPAAIESFL
jgi:hypothetical protein